MADGDHAGSRGETAPREHFRNYPLGGTPSYFFNYQVERCQQEQFGVFGSKLKEKENEANISYDKPLADLFLSAHGIDSAFLHMLFETNEPIHVDALIDDLGTKACGNPYRDGHVMRLLDFLFVTGKTSQLAEEIVIRNTTYDLYVEDVDDQFGAMDLFNKAMCDSHTMMPRCAGMQLAFSLLATGHDALVPSALVYLAKGLGFYWDALLLARYHYGAEHKVTKMVHDVWAAATLVDEKFPMLKIARSLNTANLIEVACGLIELASSKDPESKELFGAYRCLAIFLATDDSSLAPFERKLQVAEASSHMRSIYVTVLGWGKLGWARSMVVDISKRAFPGDIPTDICQIVLSCHLDLVEHLMRTQNIHTNAAFAVNDLKALAVKWKAEIGRMGGEMRKLRTGTAFAQKVLYEWLHQLTLLLSRPLVEDENPNLKMQCVFLAGQFLPDMLRWAATSQEEEKLVLIWPDLNLEINTREKDTSVHFTDSDDRRSRSLSVQSRSSNTSRDDGRKQKKKGDVKEERPVLLVRKDQKPEGNKQNVSQPVQDVRKLLELPLAGTGGTHGQENQQSRGGNGETQQWPRGEKRQSQDARNSRGTTENGSEFHGGNDNTTLHPAVAVLMAGASSKELVPSAVAVPGSTLAPTGGAPAKVDGDAYAPSVVPSDDRRKTSEEKKKAAATPAPLDVAAPAMEQVVQSLSEASQSLAEPPQPPSEANQLTPLASERSQTPTNSVSQEMILAALEDSLNKKKASAVETTAEQQANSGQARARRSQEHLLQPEQPLEEIEKEKEETTEEQKLPEASTQPADSHYLELMAHMEGGEPKYFAPDPAVMNKLFAGESQARLFAERAVGQLPARLQMEQEQSAAATTIPEPTTQPPVPSLVAQAGEEESGAHSAPPEGLVLPPSHHYASTSEESMLMLTPITEASRETLSTALSESDTTGLANDSMDTVFEESHDPNQTELHVDVDVHPSGVEQSQFSSATLSEQTTPAMSAESSLNHSPAMISHEEQYGKADTPAVSPLDQKTSPAETETRASDSSEQTTAVDQTTARMVDAVRSEAEDASQLHHPIVTPPVPLETHEELQQQQEKETIVAPVVTEWDTTQQSGFETAQTMPSSVPAAVSDAVPSFSVPPPPVDVQIQETPTQPQQTYSPSGAPSFGTKSTPVISPQQSQSAANVQQNGENTYQQAQPTFVQQNYEQQPVQQMQSMMETQLQPPITQEGYQQKDQSSMPESTGEQLTVECGQPEVQEKVTSCGVRYKFSPSTSQEEVSDATVGAELAAQQQQQSVQEPVQHSPPGFISGLLNDFLGVLGASSNGVETGDMQPDISVSADVIASNSISNMQSEGGRSVTATEIDEHAAMRCQAASELGGSDFGSSAPSPFPDASSMPPSVPSTAVTTPDYSQQQSLVENQYPHMNHLALGGGDAATSETQQTTQQQSGGFTSPYVDPFDMVPKQKLKLPPLQPITNRADAMAYQPRSSVGDEPVFFGTGGGAQTAQQQNVAPQPSGGMTFHGKKDAPGDHSQSGFGGGGGSGFGGGGSSGFGGSDSGFGPSGHGGGGGFGGKGEGRARGTGCFNCHEEGHRSNDCPQPKRVMNCYNCHKDGHSSAKCPEKILTAGFNGGSQDVRAGRSQSQQSSDGGQSGFRGSGSSGGAGFGGGNQSQQSTGGLSSGFGGGSGGAGFGGGNQSQQPTGGVSSGFGGGSGGGGQGFGDGQKGFGSGGGMGFGGGDNNQKNSQPRRGGRGAGRGARGGGGGGRQFVSTGSAGLQQGANGGFSGF